MSLDAFISLIAPIAPYMGSFGRVLLSPSLELADHGIAYGQLHDNSYALRISLTTNNPTKVPVQITSIEVNIQGKKLESMHTPLGTSASVRTSQGWKVLNPEDKPYRKNYTLEPMRPQRVYVFFRIPPPHEFAGTHLEGTIAISFSWRLPRSFRFLLPISEAPS